AVVFEKIETPDFVRAVVRAITRAHAPIVDLQIQSLVVVRRRGDRADQLARRILAVHTRHRLMRDPGTFLLARVKRANSDPMHLAVKTNLLFAYHRNIVFGLAGDGAGMAADTDIEIDDHAPFVAFVWIFRWVIQRVAQRGKLLRLVRVMWIGEKFGERAVMQNAAAFNVVMMLRANQPVPVAGLLNR